jgi:N-methylhydantoinase A
VNGNAGPTDHRDVWFSPDCAADTPIYDRDTLRPGDVISGPAVIEQLDATTLVFHDDRATVDPYLNIHVELAP